MDTANYSLTGLLVHGWIFGKPLLLAFLIFFIMQKKIYKKLTYLLISIFGGYIAWFVAGRFFLPWMANALYSKPQVSGYGEVIFKMAIIQFIDVTIICFVIYSISKIQWFRIKELS